MSDFEPSKKSKMLQLGSIATGIGSGWNTPMGRANANLGQMLQGQAENQAKKEYEAYKKKQEKSGLFGSLGSLGGGVLGTVLAIPTGGASLAAIPAMAAGGAAGSALGGTAGNIVGGGGVDLGRTLGYGLQGGIGGAMGGLAGAAMPALAGTAGPVAAQNAAGMASATGSAIPAAMVATPGLGNNMVMAGLGQFGARNMVPLSNFGLQQDPYQQSVVQWGRAGNSSLRYQ